jgi:transcriptional activator SPT8
MFQTTAPSPRSPTHIRSLSPSQLRKDRLLLPTQTGSHRHGLYVVEAICALPHPTPTHALASSLCMTHLLTGSDDGYIRDYDIFSAANSKNFLTAPQRHHCGVVEGILKSGQLRFWWENPALKTTGDASGDEGTPLSPVYSLLMHSDALWALAGTNVC